VKKRWIAAILILMLLMLTACSGKTIAGKGDSDPGGANKGYYTTGQTVSGGSELTEANLKDISIAQSGEDTVVTLSFRTGSDDSGVTESDPDNVPSYTLKPVMGVPRFVLTLEGMTYWDYALYENELGGTAVKGIFNHGALAGNSGALYFNLSKDCDFRTEQKGSQLIIYFRAQPGVEAASRWYIAANGYDLYIASEQQSLLKELGLYPTYCNDMSSIMLLSAPFESKEKAQEYLSQHEQTISRLLPGRVTSIVELSGNDLPEYDEQSQIISLIDTPVGSKNGAAYEAPVLQANGRFLCWAPDGESYVYARPVYETKDGNTISYDELWMRKENDQPVLAGHEFTHILSAAYSADGRYLAVQEQNDQLYRSLEIVDMTTGESYLPAETGFGMDTPSFAWDDEASVLYAISGEGESLKFLQYNLESEGVPVAGVISDSVTSESPLEVCNGRLYFIRWTETLDNGELCSMAVTGGEITSHTEATDFELSPDGRYAAVSGHEDAGSYLKLYDLVSGGLITVVEETMVIDMLWDVNSQKLYYTLYDLESANVDQPLMLYSYNLAEDASVKVMDMIVGTLYPASQTGEAVLVFIFTQVNQSIPMTYLLEMP